LAPHVLPTQSLPFQTSFAGVVVSGLGVRQVAAHPNGWHAVQSVTQG
jgi:hypothetical protein